MNMSIPPPKHGQFAALGNTWSQLGRSEKSRKPRRVEVLFTSVLVLVGLGYLASMASAMVLLIVGMSLVVVIALLIAFGIAVLNMTRF
jgi:hypothetical protein